MERRPSVDERGCCSWDVKEFCQGEAPESMCARVGLRDQAELGVPANEKAPRGAGGFSLEPGLQLRDLEDLPRLENVGILADDRFVAVVNDLPVLLPAGAVILEGDQP